MYDRSRRGRARMPVAYHH